MSVTANDHAKSMIITHMWTMFTQATHCLPTVKNISYEEAFKICMVKEQRPGFTGLVKQVDTVAETRVVVVDMDMVKFSVLRQCVLDFLVLYL